MAASQPNLPPDVLGDLEDCIKAAEQYGYACAPSPAGEGSFNGKSAQALFQKVQECRRKLVKTIEAHATRMYEGGIEMGLSQARAEK